MSYLRFILQIGFCGASLMQSLIAEAAPALDRRYGVDGFANIASHVGPERVLAACPHPDGGTTLVALNESPRQLIVTRMRSDGRADDDFGSGGIVVNAVDTVGDLGFEMEAAASVCSGSATPDPSDDRAVLAVTVGIIAGNNPDTQTWLARIDLATGLLDAGFGQQGVAQYNVSQATAGAFRSEWVGGLNLGANGELLLLGHFEETYEFRDQDGMIARIGPTGTLLASAYQSAAQRITAARIQGSAIQAIGDAPGNHWLLLQMDGTSLAVTAQSQGGSGLRTFKGRNAGGGAMVVAARKDAFTPVLLVVRGDSVQELMLPDAPSLDGDAVMLMPHDNGAMATGGAAGRVVYAAAARTMLQPDRALYVALVQLGNGAEVADTVETRFGAQGAASVRQQPASWNCAAPPMQYLGGVVSVGARHMLYGARTTSCSGEISGQAAMLNSDLDDFFSDGFD
ncbi:MAG TPA: hypothetical protein VN581_05980 [Patescibacteria group bacterium]|nr:hypothetical protein [Patescibacteria group bacterium]